MRLKVGQLAPAFIQRDMYQRTVSLSQYWGRKVLLSFHRAAVCPLCNLRLRYMIDHHDEYRRQGLEIIAFFESSPAMVRYYLERQRPPFPIIPDHGRRIYELYGLESSLISTVKAFITRRPAYREAAKYNIGGNFWHNFIHMDGTMGRRPADFLLSADLRIQGVYYGNDPGDFMPFAEIDRFLTAHPESFWPNYGGVSMPGNLAPGYPMPPQTNFGHSAPGHYPMGGLYPDNRQPGDLSW